MRTFDGSIPAIFAEFFVIGEGATQASAVLIPAKLMRLIKVPLHQITIAQQLVQSNHATFAMASALSRSIDGDTPSIVLIGVPNKKALERVIDKLINNRIDFSDFHEPDYDLGLTAVATVPVNTLPPSSSSLCARKCGNWS